MVINQVILCTLIFLVSLSNTVHGQTEPLRIEKFSASGIEVKLNHYSQALIPLEEEIKDVVTSAFPVASKLFGGLPRDTHGEDYTEFEINLRYGPPTANADPNVIDLQINAALQEKPLFGYLTWQLALIHEMLHFWNAETFRRSSDKEHWFNEGVTEYYAFKTAMKLRLIESTEIPSTLVLPIGHYLSDAGTGRLSMSAAGEGELKSKHYFLVYCGGLTAGIVLDYDIHATTNSTKSLDDLMKAMYRKYNRSDQRYTTADIAAELKLLTGKDYSRFFSRYIEGTEVIPVGQFFGIRDLYSLTVPGFSSSGQEDRLSILRKIFFND